MKLFFQKKRDILHLAWHSSADFTDPSKQRTFYWRLGILHGDVWGRSGGVCRVEVKGKREYPKSFLGAQEEQKRERGRSVGRIDRGVAVCFFFYISATWPWCSFGPTARGSARVQVTWGDRRVMLRKNGMERSGFTTAVSSACSTSTGTSLAPPPIFASIYSRFVRRHLPIRVTHPLDGRHRKRKLAKKRTLDETEDPRFRVLSTWPVGYLFPIPDMAVGLVCAGAENHGGVSVFSFHGRSLFVGWVWLRSRTTYEIPSDLSDSFSSTHSTGPAMLKRESDRVEGGPREVAAAPGILIPMIPSTYLSSVHGIHQPEKKSLLLDSRRSNTGQSGPTKLYYYQENVPSWNFQQILRAHINQPGTIARRVCSVMRPGMAWRWCYYATGRKQQRMGGVTMMSCYGTRILSSMSPNEPPGESLAAAARALGELSRRGHGKTTMARLKERHSPHGWPKAKKGTGRICCVGVWSCRCSETLGRLDVGVQGQRERVCFFCFRCFLPLTREAEMERPRGSQSTKETGTRRG